MALLRRHRGHRWNLDRGIVKSHGTNGSRRTHDRAIALTPPGCRIVGYANPSTGSKKFITELYTVSGSPTVRVYSAADSIPAWHDRLKPVVIRSKRKGSRCQTRRFVITMTMDEEDCHADRRIRRGGPFLEFTASGTGQFVVRVCLESTP